MEINEIVNKIELFFKKKNKTFFPYLFEESLGEILLSNTKLDKLVKWLDCRIEYNRVLADITNPATEILEDNKNYYNAIFEIALCLDIKYIMIHKNCTNIIRERLENHVCKKFKIHYNEELGYIEN